MGNGLAWTAIGISAGSLVVAGASFGWTWSQQRSKRQGRLALGPSPDELRAALVKLRTLFTGIVADGGKDKAWFLGDDDRRHVAVHLRDQANRVGDRQLKEAAKEAAGTWDRAFAHAPPEQGPRAYNLSGPYPEIYRQQDLERDQRMGSVIETADQGTVQCHAAIQRLNELEASAPEV